ncbi:Lipoprotein-releasing system ATP-binding protein LolD [Zhongshania aliphaticivorans]|uniref:Lipoprotein-releasing system ATP-binding protein LolD n=1 Tax=Zhongshania aliphaticivorans TaxID=1470434 RepID=A0A5S9P246_9GAMM|nr:ABC transporter ATP-binding protein [Zhongshania aliphaticivorans]CAA0090020.1 Lipoprotein-releasing system ATP-binding protein LolD [Zhongshania aliphaticivorans]CAA0097244.1 Lipoprotein-releasing system ATP-binding protein LolD [Zhongshania aliphaticivorans]
MLVSIQDLSVVYGDATSPVLEIPQWSLQAGERVFIHGPSGAGKSTLLNMLAGILLPNSGTITILDKPINKLSGRKRDKWRAQHIGVVFQQFNLIPYLSAIENIKLAAYFGGSRNTTQRATELLISLKIDKQLHQQATARLSIGQQQRVAIARALINQPELLIVDEPTSALDEYNRDVFMSLLLEQVNQHRTALIFVSHDLALAKMFSRVEAISDINKVGEQV